MAVKQKITPFFWYDSEAETAAEHYTSIFPNSRILAVTRYGQSGPGPVGSVMTVRFMLDGMEVVAINAGPIFKFTEAISMVVNCEDQDEIDHYWNKLSDGGEPGPCGWLKDRFGLSWQIVPAELASLMADAERGNRVMSALMGMRKLDIAKLRAAHRG